MFTESMENKNHSQRLERATFSYVDEQGNIKYVNNIDTLFPKHNATINALTLLGDHSA